jgi:5'-nucleotidase
MNKDRRLFLSQLTLLSGTAALSAPLNPAAAVMNYVDEVLPSAKKIDISHTSDLCGNNTALSKIKNTLAKETTGGVLLDAGGFIDASKSFSEQSQMVYTMNAMGYLAVGLSNDELAQGHDNLAILADKMRFSIVNCNHQFGGKLARLVKPYLIIRYNNLKIGITGVSSPLTGAQYSDVIPSANKTAILLKNEKKCDLVICLSHLGNTDGSKNANQELAKQSEHIDMVICGGNGKLYPNALVLHNNSGHEVIVAHTASKGLMAGNTVINFDKNRKKAGIIPKSFIPGDDRLYEVAFAELKKNRTEAIIA